jgi:hypothetical protein
MNGTAGTNGTAVISSGRTLRKQKRVRFDFDIAESPRITEITGSIFGKYHTDILEIILSFCSIRDLASFGATCKEFLRLTYSENVWKPRLIARFYAESPSSVDFLRVSSRYLYKSNLYDFRVKSLKIRVCHLDSQIRNLQETIQSYQGRITGIPDDDRFLHYGISLLMEEITKYDASYRETLTLIQEINHYYWGRRRT